MIALACLATFFLLGFVFMVVELYRAPHGVQDENGFRVLKKEPADKHASPISDKASAAEKGERREGILAPPVGFGGPGGR